MFRLASYSQYKSRLWKVFLAFLKAFVAETKLIYTDLAKYAIQGASYYPVTLDILVLVALMIAFLLETHKNPWTHDSKKIVIAKID